MSPSDVESEPATERLGRLSREVSTTVDRILAGQVPAVLAVEDLRRLFSSAIRLYAGVSAVVAEEVDPLDGDVTPTDAVVAACALLKSHDLNPFDLSLWFSR
jgi:hypothetical protein